MPPGPHGRARRLSQQPAQLLYRRSRPPSPVHGAGDDPVRDGYRLLRCERCGRQVRICRRCDHGQRYCSEGCRLEARRLSLRHAGTIYQRTVPGALLHAARQRAFRRRRGERVTHHPSTVRASTDILTPTPADPSPGVTGEEERHADLDRHRPSGGTKPSASSPRLLWRGTATSRPADRSRKPSGARDHARRPRALGWRAVARCDFCGRFCLSVTRTWGFQDRDERPGTS